MKNIVSGKGVKVWWLPLITGIISLVLGIWTLANPAPAMAALAYVFAFGLIGAGVINVGLGLSLSRRTPGWGWTLALGVIELIAGAWLAAMPETTVVSTFVFVVGCFIVLAALNSLCEAFAMSLYSVWGILLAVVLLVTTIILGIVFLSDPIGGGLVVWFWLGLSFISFGLYRIVLAFRLRTTRLS